ncbi:hypothetical protein THAOC_28487 [Thalassiosira oceanica]|uniref:Uncharacterized protein n=1 Tax=Thalassiosira oceanica TaxID=159749 RepID=K0RJ17_THAOC|nr:hypothetical protein THAOC_28487 [Thalassiosira oceanica]|eukprot:EJK52264.1 hypothetical protein THAOC_28487 [Thalassiosira oceanica]
MLPRARPAGPLYDSTHNNGDLGDVNCSVSSSVLCPPGASIRRQEEHARVRLLDDRAGPAAIYGSRPAAKEESNQTPTSSSKPGQECACESAIQQARAPPSRAIQGKAAEPLEGTLPWVAASFQKPPARAGCCGDVPNSPVSPSAAKPDAAESNDTSTNKAAAFCSEMDATTRVGGFLASSLQVVASIFGFVAYWAIQPGLWTLHVALRGGMLMRLDFPILGHFDTWRVDAIQNLVWKNHRIQIYPGWTNASDYKDTEESFDTVALHSQPLHDALEKRMGEIDASSLKLSRENKYLADSVGAKLPFLPFISDEENVLYAHCVLDGNFPLHDDEKAAIAWCKHVDGVKIMPKLPVHMRTHREAFKRNQRVRDSVTRAEKGQSALDKLNEVIKSAKPSTPAVAMPAALPTLGSEAADRSSNKVVAGVVTGDLPESEANQQNSGKRGPDKKARKSRQGFTRTCKLCAQWAPDHMNECTGRGGSAKCDLFDSEGSRRCGRCIRAYLKDKADQKTEGLHAKTCFAATCDVNSFDPNCCEHYIVDGSNRVKRRK